MTTFDRPTKHRQHVRTASRILKQVLSNTNTAHMQLSIQLISENYSSLSLNAKFLFISRYMCVRMHVCCCLFTELTHIGLPWNVHIYAAVLVCLVEGS